MYYLLAKNSNSWLDYVVFFLVVAYSVCLAMFDYSDRDNTSLWNQNINKIKLTIIILFGFEAAIRIIALGLIMHHNSYLRSGWHVMDLCVFIFGY